MKGTDSNRSGSRLSRMIDPREALAPAQRSTRVAVAASHQSHSNVTKIISNSAKTRELTSTPLREFIGGRGHGRSGSNGAGFGRAIGASSREQCGSRPGLAFLSDSVPEWRLQRAHRLSTASARL